MELAATYDSVTLLSLLLKLSLGYHMFLKDPALVIALPPADVSSQPFVLPLRS